MKRLLMLLILVIGLVAVMAIPSFADNPVTCGCYKKQNGQLRLVSDPSECNPSEQPIWWNNFCPEEFSAITIYVAPTGKDAPGRGLSPHRPFKTIQYALDKITPLRANPEIPATISVAPGTYDEMIYVNKGLIFLTGSGNGNTFLTNSTGKDVLTIEGARGVVISGFTVQGGLKGIYGRRNATFEVRDAVVRDTVDRGVQIDENSTAQIVNCTVQGCGTDGIVVLRSSSASFGGTTTCTNNKARGMLVNMTSTAMFTPDSSALFNGNAGRGIYVDDVSSLFLYRSTVEASANGDDGIGIYGGSKLSINFGSTVTCNGNKNGLFAGGSSSIFMEGQGTLNLQNNAADGLLLVSNSNVDLRGKSNITDNALRGAVCIESSAIRLDGATLLQGNGLRAPQEYAALHVGRGSHARIMGKVEILENHLIGVAAYKGSSIELEPASTTNILIKDNLQDGIRAMFNSQISSDVPSVPPASIQVIGNGGRGVFLDHNSAFSVRSANKATKVTGHSSNPAIQVLRNSQLFMYDCEITNNPAGGLLADDSTAELNNCDVTGNGQVPGIPNIQAYFGSRISLPGSSIGSMNCDSSVLCRGSTLCPVRPIPH